MERINKIFYKSINILIEIGQMSPLFLLGLLMSGIYFNFHNIRIIINAFSSNEVQIIGNIISVVGTILAASIGVWMAFKQLKNQFEHKVIYEAWTDFQKLLFNFSSALTEFDGTVLWMHYFINSQNNPIVNRGNIYQHRLDKWNELNEKSSKLQQAYLLLLVSFETHEIVFISLQKMCKEFQEEFRNLVSDPFMPFMDSVFPDMYGKKDTHSDDELNKLIDEYWLNSTKISAYLEDFRIELQNETVGKILNKKLDHRVPPIESKILTKKGFINFIP